MQAWVGPTDLRSAAVIGGKLFFRSLGRRRRIGSARLLPVGQSPLGLLAYGLGPVRGRFVIRLRLIL